MPEIKAQNKKNLYSRRVGSYKKKNLYSYEIGSYNKKNLYSREVGSYKKKNLYSCEVGSYNKKNLYSREVGSYKKKNLYSCEVGSYKKKPIFTRDVKKPFQLSSYITFTFKIITPLLIYISQHLFTLHRIALKDLYIRKEPIRMQTYFHASALTTGA